MNKTEAVEIMELLYAFYPNFNKNKMENFNQIWIDRLCEGDYRKTVQKVKQYTADSSFPPALADVFVKKHVPHEQVDMTIKADRERVEAEMADPEKRAEREQKFEQLKEMQERMRKDVYERPDS
ncbi:replicative helicase loader/inhibitor [Salinicoccus albus]|uniref:replicative helicase loader/inhibitor n=1 Tax=Salinicoccus albus TaxID=418756 RepID=UPI000381A603|nr:replicative helicase loader/inhibitor [Salinicoccus albus]